MCVCVCIVELFHLGHFKSSKYLQIPLLKNDLIHVWNGFRRVRKKIYQACNNKRFSLEGGVQEKTCLTLEANNFYDKKKKRRGDICVHINFILHSTGNIKMGNKDFTKQSVFWRKKKLKG